MCINTEKLQITWWEIYMCINPLKLVKNLFLTYVFTHDYVFLLSITLLFYSHLNRMAKMISG